MYLYLLKIVSMIFILVIKPSSPAESSSTCKICLHGATWIFLISSLSSYIIIEARIPFLINEHATYKLMFINCDKLETLENIL